MKVSVIIPYTDREIPVLYRATDSVLAQTYKNVEFMQVYDKHRQGIGKARNHGLAHTNGCYVLPLDADDTIEPTFLEKTIAKMEAEVGIVSTAFRYTGDVEREVVLRDGPRTLHQQLESNKITGCSLIRRDAVERAGGWFEGINGWEDWDLWIRILRDGWRHEYVDEVLFNYTFTRTGMNTFANERREKYLEILRQRHKGFRG